jgi:hypothetical protein
MLQEQKEVELLYAEFENFANKLPPVVTPPKLPSIPAPKPVEPPTVEPEPTKPEKPTTGTPTNWKKSLSWIGGVASALLIVWSVVSMALPGWASMLGKVILQLLANVFGS